MKLSVLIPVFNEKDTIEPVVGKVLSQKVDGIDSLEIVIVDDASSDGTDGIIKSLISKHDGKVISLVHDKNRGKGAAIKTAIDAMTGDICIIQDADLEYDPKDYPIMLEPIISGIADCVYGSRFVGMQSKRVLFFWHFLGNKFLTLLSNIFTNLNLTDMETCYKAFKCDILKTIPIRSARFGFEPEITAKISKRKLRIYEVGISYRGRTYEEGKKITWVDGVKAAFLILKFWIINDSAKK
ncbi:MAG: glycosyltransferase family 2 protein [Candidatus Zapsychrus exili]|nr:glycosyltransferase family 2 protein [Candidatus Zapsychrus exili]